MEAQEKYFMQQMGVVPKQVAITLKDNAIRLKPGLMQFMFGNIQQTSGVTGVSGSTGSVGLVIGSNAYDNSSIQILVV